MSVLGVVTTTPNKTLLTTPHPFEQQFGYHRAVRRGPFISVSGTTALKLLPPQAQTQAQTSDPINPPTREAGTSFATSSKVHFPGDAHAQSVLVFETCLAAVARLGGTKDDIVRVRMFVANHEDCGVVGDALREVFGHQGGGLQGDDPAGVRDVVGVAATMIVVPGGFVDKDILVEIEVDAFVV